MLNVGRLRPGAADYYVGEIALSADDYYLGRGEAPGRWVGSLAAEMGLQGEVDPEHFRTLLEGKHPLTGEQLVAPPRTKAPYVSVAPEGDWLTAGEAAAQLGASARFVRRLLASGKIEGEKARSETTGRTAWRVRRAHVNIYAVSHKPAKRRPGFDLTLRPPKGVSVLWALSGADRRAVIRQAHREAVDEVIRYYEGQAIMARFKGDRIQTGGLVAAFKPKDRSVDPNTLANAWRERADALGFDERAIEACFDRAQRRGTPDLARIFEHLAGPHGLTERASTFTRRDVVQQLATELRAAPAEDIERLADRFIASDSVILLAGPTSGVNSQVVIGLDNRRLRAGGTAVFSTPELIEIETRLLQWAEQRRSARRSRRYSPARACST